jgi:pSer/pThr/pTyr-binding forkhead associated (FHA) protein
MRAAGRLASAPEEVGRMKDGSTRRVATQGGGAGRGFLAKHKVTLVLASGPHAGNEVALEQERVTMGRNPQSDVALQDASVSSEHAALELGERGYRLRDLGSTNGVQVNGCKIAVAELKHGDRFELGKVSFRYVVETRRAAPPTHHVDE